VNFLLWQFLTYLFKIVNASNLWCNFIVYFSI
jgi:hypothetical protein